MGNNEQITAKSAFLAQRAGKASFAAAIFVCYGTGAAKADEIHLYF